MVPKFAPLVKRQIEYWQHQIDRFSPDHPRYRPQKIERYQHLVNDFGHLLAYLIGQEGEPPPEPKRQPRRSIANPQHQVWEVAERAQTPPPQDDLSDLPPELLAELSEGVRAEKDPLIRIIDERGGTASLDEILIDLYRKHREVGKRNLTANKLYRLSKRGLCWALPGKKGIYTTTKPLEASVSKSDSETDEGSADGSAEPSSSQSSPSTPPGQRQAAPRFKPRTDLFASTAIPPIRTPH